MSGLDPSEAVTQRTFVAAETRTESMIQAYGRVIGYTDAPTYIIEKPDGTQLTWRADLCRPATESEVARLLHAVLDADAASVCKDVPPP